MVLLVDMKNLNPSDLKDIVVIYHAHCQDGFGSAFAAYKKLGDTATYIPCSDRAVPPEGPTEKEIYILDFSYPKEVLLELEKTNKRLVIIDHHLSAQEAVMSVREHVFSLEHSGAYLAWEYFVGDKPPHLFMLLEVIDLKKDTSTDVNDLITYILSKPYTFEAYEQLLHDCNDDGRLASIRVLGRAQHDYLELLISSLIDEPDFVVFEGYTVPCVNLSLPINEKSIALSELYTKYPPFAMSYRFDDGFVKVSLRGNGEVDLTTLAEKYGGGGHRNSSGFILPSEYPLPFVTVKEKEESPK